MERRVVITGIGWVTPLGHDIDTVWRRLLAGESGVGPTTLFDASTFPTAFSAQVKAFSLDAFLNPADAARHAGASRNAQFAIAAAAKAWRCAGLDRDLALDSTRVGVYLGGGEGPIDFDPFASAAVAGCRDEAGQATPLDTVRWAKTAMRILNATVELEQDPNLAGGHLAVLFNAAGPNRNTLTACAASTQALGEAMHLIAYGDADVMISGGTHTMIHPLGVTGFNRLTALSTRNDEPRAASRPFDRTRDGFVLGEGAGVLILESLDRARRRDANILAELVGYGSTADAFRITDIHEGGRGGIAAMESALASAGLTPADVNYISAHGTGTEENDKIETLALRTVFGEHADTIAVSSIKSMIGHLIAAAGAVELITC
ncbi:MAG: beta-ketoacyl-[acyl-carrier-protein] synthase family protein, partial [Phycisphaerae bacterium]